MTVSSADRKWFTGKVFLWTLFDFANSSYAVIVVAFVYAVYFKKVVALNLPVADFYWSSSINISMIIVALLAPVLGAAADHYGNKKLFLIFFTFLAIITTAFLFFVREGMILWGMLLFILSNIGFQAGLGFYDAFIKEITEPENYNKVSSAGYAVGYIGSLAALAVVLVLQDNPPLMFAACAGLYLIFSLPMFIFIKERSTHAKGTGNISSFLSIGIKRTADTIKHVKNYSNLRKFLLSYFLYIDGVNTIIFFSGIYAQTTLGFSMSELVIFFVIVQVTALLGSFIFGYIADKRGTKKTISLIIILWTILTLAVYLVTDKVTFMIIGFFAGFLLGSSQALSRSFMSTLVPDEKKTEFFGFYGLFEKTSTILGPFTFGIISWLTGDQRLAALALSVFFISGYLLLKNVTDPMNVKLTRIN
ncbi:MAG: MFS transporter [Ignavibacteriae bacterium]|nr:MAG: MFS transporter [Ignavibacteriota bacterium]